MQDSVIFNSPVILAGIFIILLLMLLDLRYHSGGYILPFVTTLASVLLTLYTIIAGAELQEVAILLMIFLVFNIFGYSKGGQK